jgi:hypothetical protein
MTATSVCEGYFGSFWGKRRITLLNRWRSGETNNLSVDGSVATVDVRWLTTRQSLRLPRFPGELWSSTGCTRYRQQHKRNYQKILVETFSSFYFGGT